VAAREAVRTELELGLEFTYLRAGFQGAVGMA